MSTSSARSLANITQQVTLYLGFVVLIVGIIGGILNLIVFLSLRTFRQNSCAFYLIIMSFANVIHLIVNWIPGIVINGFKIDLINNSVSYCNTRVYLLQFWSLTSLTCMCLATIDQYLATCFNPYWHRFNNIKLARYIMLGVFLVWILHGIPFAVFYNLIPSSTNPNQSTCAITNTIFLQYYTFFYVFVMVGVLPLTLMTLFGLLAYLNVRNLAYRTIPLVHRELDKQITKMVIVQVIYNFFVLTPYIIINLAAFIIPMNVEISLIRLMCVIVQNFYFASPFYIYVCVSKRFRQQLIHVLFTLYPNRWCNREIMNNRIEPQS